MPKAERLKITRVRSSARGYAARFAALSLAAAVTAACGQVVGDAPGAAYPRLSVDGAPFEEIETVEVRVEGEHIDTIEERIDVGGEKVALEVPAGERVTVEVRALEQNGASGAWLPALYRGEAESPLLEEGAEQEIAVSLGLPQPSLDEEVVWADAATASNTDEFEAAIDRFVGADAGEGEAFLLLVNDDIEVQDDALDAGTGGDLYILGESLDDERPVTFDGGEVSGIITAESAGDDLAFHLENLRFEGGAGDSGGAVFVGSGTSRLSVVDTEFVGNVADGEAGGALYFFPGGGEAEEVRIVDSTFESNGAIGAGGAVMVDADGTEVTVSGSSFIDNSASQGGAAAFEDVDDLDIRDSTFEGNVAEFAGGALYIDPFDAGGRIRLENSTFQSSFATASAVAAVIGDHPPVEILSSTFVENSVDDDAGVITGDGTLESTDSVYIENDDPLFVDFSELVDGEGNEFDPEEHEPLWGILD